MLRRAYKLIPKAGSIKNLKCIEEEIRDPGDGEVLVEVKSIGLNFADVPTLLGLYKAAPDGSFVPGLEYAGIIKASGPGINNFREGDRVMGITRFGGYADHIIIPSAYIAPMPPDWSFDEGAGYMVHSLTAYYALVRLADIREKQTVLIQSAAGGVGIMANRLAKKFNAYTIGTIGNKSKTGIAEEEGYDKVIVRSENFRSDLVQALEGRPLHIVLESIGGKVLKDAFRILAPEGRMVVFGSASFLKPGQRPDYFDLFMKYWKRPLIDPMKLPQWNKSVMGFNLIYLYEQRERLHQYLDHLKELSLGKPRIGHTFPFNGLIDGITLLQSGKSTGKVVIRV